VLATIHACGRRDTYGVETLCILGAGVFFRCFLEGILREERLRLTMIVSKGDKLSKANREVWQLGKTK
jgi:hypothetical protein